MLRARTRRTARLLGVVTLAAAVLGATATANAASRALYRPQALGSPLAVGFAPGSVPNPHGNLPPSPNYLQACAEQGWSNKSCVVQALSAIEHARKHEGVKKPRLVLPNNYDALSTAEQTFVITDLERTARGLKPFRGLTATLNTASHLAAVLRLDPTPAISLLRLLGVTEYGAIWAGDFGPLASDYDWMYNDGYSASGSINIVCLVPRSSGCWGHRENILGGYHSAPTLLAGAGTGQPAGASIAEVLTGGYGRAPKFTYTWKQAVRHGAANARASS